MGITLDKIEAQAPGLLSLAKNAQLSLQKRNFTGQIAKVVQILDFSGSMRVEYQNGAVQRLAEKVLALSTQFDDDGAVDTFFFDSRADYAGELSINDYQGGIDRLTRGRRMGTTDYAAAINLVVEHFGFSKNTGAGKRGFMGFGKASGPTPLTAPAPEPVFVIFQTDGAPDDPRAATEALRAASYAPIFWKFLSISPKPIPFLEQLDEMSGRYIDNASYSNVRNVDKVTDSELFDMLLDEYPSWVEEQRRRGQIR